MSKKQIRVLLALTAVAAALAVTLALLMLPGESGKQEPGPLVSFDAAQLTMLRYEKNGVVTELSRTADGWQMTNDASFPVSKEAANSMVQALLEAKAEQVVPLSEEDCSEYGLDTPQLLVTLMMQDGSSKTLAFGTINAVTEQVYVCTDGEEQGALTSLRVLGAFGDALDLLKYPEIPRPETQRSVKLQNEAGGLALCCDAAETSGEDGVWYVLTDDEWVPADQEMAYNFYFLTWDLHWRGCVRYDASPEELKTCGLDSPRVRYELTYDQDGKPVTFTLLFGSDLPDGTCYVQESGSNGIYLLDSIVADWLQRQMTADVLPKN